MAQRRNDKQEKYRPRNNAKQGQKPQEGGTQNVEKNINSITRVYSQNPRLVEDAGRLSFAQSLGTPFHLGYYGTVVKPQVDNYDELFVPGIARLALEPSYGGSLIPTSPLNMATRKIYSFVRHANSGRSNYEAADLMLYLLQMNEILSLYSWFVRLYGISRLYNGKNRYYPKRIIESMGVDFEELIQNLADFRFQLNVFATKIASVNIPLNFPLFEQSVNMYSQIFLDGLDAKAQSYYFDIQTYYKFDAKTENTGGKLTLNDWVKPVTGTKVSVFALIDKLNELLDVVLQDEDMNIMSGDILKAYGSESMLVLPTIQDDYTVIPVYDESALDMIRNASVTSRNKSSATITQKDQLLVSEPIFVTTSPTNTLGKMISLNNDNPSPLDVMISTRLSLITPATQVTESDRPSPTTLNDYLSNGAKTHITTGSHILTEIRITDNIATHPIEVDTYYDSQSIALLNSTYYTTTLPTMFRSFPLRASYFVIDAQGYSFGSFAGDIQNYTILGLSDLTKLHETALLSLFGI